MQEQQKKKYLCIYHDKCIDGFGAAWAVRKGLVGEDVEFFSADYGCEAPGVTGKHVIIVDFSYSADQLVEMSHKAESVLVLDHHKSAALALASFPKFTAGCVNDMQHGSDHFFGYETAFAKRRARGESAIACCFDMTRSGAMLAWNHFFPGQQPPDIIRHVQDRDLWQFKLEGTREITTAIYSYPSSFELWDHWVANSLTKFHLRTEGTALLRGQAQNIKVMIDNNLVKMMIGGYAVEAVNAPKMYASEIGNILAKTNDFGVTYFDTLEYREFSLRGEVGKIDVSLVAEQYGGGGHVTSAGFKVPHSHRLASLK